MVVFVLVSGKPSADARVPLALGLGVAALTLWLLGSDETPAKWIAGVLVWPTPSTLAYLALWAVFGTIAAILLMVGVARGLGGRLESWRGRILELEPVVVTGAAVAAFIIPFAIRMLVLEDAPVTDDEGAYRFSAELLASGRLTAPSPPEKLFFDRAFMINDGRWYSQYFLGWPALQVPFVWLGAPGYANAAYSAATVPFLHGVLRRLVGARWAPVGLLLYVTSPMFMIAAATELSHTTCLFALVMSTWLLLRCLDRPDDLRFSAGLAGALSLAFFVRPLPALALGAVLSLAWLRTLWGRRRWRRPAFAFGLAATLAAGLFLTVNWAQNGAPLRTAYAEYRAYAEANDYRFTHYRKAEQEAGKEVVNMDFDHPERGLSTLGAGTVRLWFSLFGWPCGLLLALVPSRRRWIGWARGSVLCYLVSHAFVTDAGVDVFGPTHFFELGWPLLLLTVAGAADLEAWARRARPEGALRQAPLAAITVLVALAWAGFVPTRLGQLRTHATAVHRLFDAPAEEGLHQAVVFSFYFGVAYCDGPSRGWVFWRPNPSFDLDDDVIWANHVSVAEDRRLMETVFPDREGYVVVWTTGCEVKVLDLARVGGRIPPGQQECCAEPPFFELAAPPR